MRHYLEERFAFRATALTTRELESRMGAEGVERWQSRLAEGCSIAATPRSTRARSRTRRRRTTT